ncbi:MAG: DUF3775 domain-containing protein [Gammaproteobacteria bacterium]|nr:DUF3775 domain-containing protein [Gammaproteobacteria bacterium]
MKLRNEKQAQRNNSKKVFARDFEKAEWDAAYEEAQRVWNHQTAEYLLTKPLLADFLEEALDQFGQHCNE